MSYKVLYSSVASIDNWRANINLFVFTNLENNRFQEKSMIKNTTYEYLPLAPIINSDYAMGVVHMGTCISLNGSSQSCQINA